MGAEAKTDNEHPAPQTKVLVDEFNKAGGQSERIALSLAMSACSFLERIARALERMEKKQ